MNLTSIGLIILLLFGIVVLSLLFIFVVSIVFEIPELIRSRRLFNLACKYELTFQRIKKEKRTWLNGWGIFSNDESNFISGKIKNVTIEFNDCLLVEGTLNNLSVYGTGLHSEPSIAEVSNRWNLSGTNSGATTQKVSKLNEIYYSRLKLKELSSFFEKVHGGEINSVEEVKSFFEKKDFSHHVMKNTQVARFVSSLLFIFIFFLAIFVYNNTNLLDFKDALLWVFIGDILINIVVYAWVAKRYGKKFASELINEAPTINPKS